MGVLGFRAGAAFLTGVALAGGGIFLEAALLSEAEVFLAEAAGLLAGAGFLLVVLGFFLGGGWRFLGAGLFWLLWKTMIYGLNYFKRPDIWTADVQSSARALHVAV